MSAQPAPPREHRAGRMLVLLGRSLRLCWVASGWLFVAAASAQLLAAIVLLVQLLAVRWLLTTVLESGRAGLLERVASPVALLVACLALAAAGNAVRTSVQPLVSERISRYTLGEVMAVAANSELEHFESPELFDRLFQTTVRAVSRPQQMANGVLSLVAGLGGVAAVGAAMIGVSPWLVLVVVVGGVPAYLASTRTSRVLYAFDRARAESDRRRSYLQTMFLTRPPAKEVRGYQLEAPLLRRWQDISADRLRQLGGLTRSRLVTALGSSLVGAVLTGAAVILLVALVERGSITLAAAGAGALALLLLANQVQSLVASIASLQESALFVEDYFEFVCTGTPTRFVGTAAPERHLREVRFENVSFAYPGSCLVLHDVDLTVGAGQVVALVGRNGSGKSTLVKLLCALYPASGGAIRWNGAPYAELDVRALRSAITPVFQDPTQFQLPLRDYVALGRAGDPVDEQRVAESLDRADMAAPFASLGTGLDTQLGPEFLGGADLSGGQWQRLALARALYRRGELVVLDEPASALDPLTEADLFGHVRDLFPGAGILIVSHRFGSVRDADVIHVMDEGRIVESGDHQTLMSCRGLYARMFEAQRSSLLGGPDTAI